MVSFSRHPFVNCGCNTPGLSVRHCLTCDEPVEQHPVLSNLALDELIEMSHIVDDWTAKAFLAEFARRAHELKQERDEAESQVHELEGRIIDDGWPY